MHFRVQCIFAIVIFIVFLSFSLACEVDTKVSVDGKNPPTFSFQGTGYLTFFTVEQIAVENQNVPDVEQDRTKNRTIWSIWPSQPLDTPMKNTAPITYGKVPAAFYQKIPQEGQPETLAEGKVYEAGGPAASADGGYERFGCPRWQNSGDYDA